MDGETIDRHPGERARPGSPPGWYADPIRESSLRRWNGEHWTADVDPPAAVADPTATVGEETTAPDSRAYGLTLALLATSPLVVYTWQVAHEYASDHGAQHGDNDFAWMPLGVWFLGLLAWLVLAFVALLRAGPLSDRGAAAWGLAVAVAQVLAIHGTTVAVSGEPSVFPGGSDVLARVVIGGIASLVPLSLALAGTVRPRWGRRRGPPGASVAARYSVFGTVLVAAWSWIAMSEELFPAVLVAVLVVGVLAGVYGLVSVRRVEASIGLVLCAVPLVLLWGSLPSDVLGSDTADPGVESVASGSSVAFGVVYGRTVLASGSWDGTVRLWDPATGTQIGEALKGHAEEVSSVAFGVVDGRTVLASGSWDRTVRLWDPATGTRIGKPLKGHDEEVTSVAFGVADGRTVLASGDWVGVRLWDPATGTRIGKVLKGQDGVESVAFGVVGGRTVLASGSWDGTVRLWDPANGTQIGNPLKARDVVGSVAFGVVDGRTVLASGNWDGTVRLWDPANGTQIGKPLKAREKVTSVAFGVVDGRTVLASGDWVGVRLWDPATGTRIGTVLEGQDGVELVSFGVAFGVVDGRTVLASGGWNGVRLWDPADGTGIGQPLT